ncbi:hypothetical protein evm_009947 [Chilo suppressalis]|nr:hypothetical protein evm_009947 [Chilo suppressalis]
MLEHPAGLQKLFFLELVADRAVANHRYCVCRQSQSFRLEQKKFNSLPTMDKKRSKLWGFFTQTKDDKAKCDLCHSLYSVKGGSTTNLKKHLMKKHRPTYETIVPGSVSVAAALEAPTSASTESTNPVIITNETNSQQTKLSAFITRQVGVVREKKNNDLIFKMIVKDLQPFSVVEDAGFKDLIT